MKSTRSRRTSLLLTGGTLALLVPCCPTRCIGQDAPNREGDRLPVLVKIPLLYVRVEEVADSLGFPVMPTQTVYHGSGAAAALLPPGIEQIYGYERDNTLIVRGTPDAIRDMKRVLELFDIPTPQIAIHAEAVLTLRDKAGHRRDLRMTADGRVTGMEPLFLKTGFRSGAGARGVGVKEGYCRFRVEAQVQRDGTIHLAYFSRLNYLVRSPGAKTPIHLDKDVTSGGVVGNGRALILVRSTVQFDAGSAEMMLKLTPRRLVSASAQAPKEKVHAHL